MEFLNPWVFLLLVLPIVVFFVKERKLPFKKEVLQKILLNSSQKRRFYFYLISFFCFVVALSRPIGGISKKVIEVRGENLIILLDGGKNMAKTDIYPNRYEAAVKKISEFLKKLNNCSVALILVKNYPYLISPFTTDYDSIIYLLDHVSRGDLFNSKSNFSLAVKKAKRLDKSALILNVSFIPRGEISYVVNSKKFQGVVNFSYSNQDINELLKLINAKNKTQKIIVFQTKELFYYPLILGLLFFFVGTFSFRRGG